VAETGAPMAGTCVDFRRCARWYPDGSGRKSTPWPDFTGRFRRRAVRLDRTAYLTRAVDA